MARRLPTRSRRLAPRAACCGEHAPVASPRLKKALAVDASIKEANFLQLRRIEGQIRGIAAMMEQDRYCADIITQVAAARESLRTVATNLLMNHLKHCAAAAMAGDASRRERMIKELASLMTRFDR